MGGVSASSIRSVVNRWPRPPWIGALPPAAIAGCCFFGIVAAAGPQLLPPNLPPPQCFSFYTDGRLLSDHYSRAINRSSNHSKGIAMRGVATDSTLWAALYQYASADQSDPEMWVRNQSISLGGSSIALTSGPSTAGKRLYHLALLARLPQWTLRPFLGAQHCPYGPSAALCVAAPAPTVC